MLQSREHIQGHLLAAKPKSTSEVRSFLGLVNFSGRFIQNLAVTDEPLRKLTRHGEHFKWGQAQDHAFEKLKSELSNTDTLAYYVQGAHTEVVVDASPIGLGAMLVQTQAGVKRVICYASRSLSQVERRYSQTEKEALGIVWACERFQLYLLGIHFVIVTDHKPLMYIYSPKSKASARIERWVLRLQPFTFTVKHIPGREMVADALSRLIQTQSQESDTAEEYIRLITQEATPCALKTRDIERESANDFELETVRNCISSNNFSECPKEYKPVRNELCCVGKIVLIGCRIVVPKSMRQSNVYALKYGGRE